MKWINPLSKKIWPYETEELLWNTKKKKITVPYFLVSYHNKMHYPEQSETRQCLKITQLKLTPWCLWRYRVERPWFCTKTAAWRSHSLRCKRPDKTEETQLGMFHTVLRRYSKSRKQSVSLFWFFYSIIYYWRYPIFLFQIWSGTFLSQCTTKAGEFFKATYVHVRVIVPRQNYHHQLHLIKVAISS